MINATPHPRYFCLLLGGLLFSSTWVQASPLRTLPIKLNTITVTKRLDSKTPHYVQPASLSINGSIQRRMPLPFFNRIKETNSSIIVYPLGAKAGTLMHVSLVGNELRGSSSIERMRNGKFDVRLGLLDQQGKLSLYKQFQVKGELFQYRYNPLDRLIGYLYTGMPPKNHNAPHFSIIESPRH